MDHASVFTVQTEPSVVAKKAGLFPVWWLNLLRNLATKCDQSHLFCLGNSAKLGVKALSKLRRWRRKWQGFFGFFRFQSWWHYTFEGRLSLTWSNDSGCSGWSAQLFACSFLLCEMSTSKPLDIFQRTPSGKLVHSNTWKEKKQTLFILVVFAWGRIQATWNNLAILWIQSFSYSGFQCFFVLNGDFSGDLIGLVFINTVNMFQCLVSNLRKLAQAGWCMHPNTL